MTHCASSCVIYDALCIMLAVLSIDDARSQIPVVCLRKLLKPRCCTAALLHETIFKLKESTPEELATAERFIAANYGDTKVVRLKEGLTNKEAASFMQALAWDGGGEKKANPRPISWWRATSEIAHPEAIYQSVFNTYSFSTTLYINNSFRPRFV